MAITSYIDSNGLRLMVTQLPSGAFDLYFSNGIISTCMGFTTGEAYVYGKYGINK